MRLPALILGFVVAAAGGLTAGCAAGGAAGGCRPAQAVSQADLARPLVPPVKKKKTTQPPICTKATSPVWKKFKPYRGNIKTNGEPGSKRRYYTWDYTHGDIEVWDADGNHLGSLDPSTGDMTKPPVKGRQNKGVK
jgi:Cytotoxic